MRAGLGVLREEQKFFVDSFTAAATVGPAVARETAVPYAVNQVFLDHEDDEEAIRAQLRRLADLARQRGAAVGIGHVRPRTYRALVEMLPELQAQGFEFVTVSEILNMPAPEAAAARGTLRRFLRGRIRRRRRRRRPRKPPPRGRAGRALGPPAAAGAPSRPAPLGSPSRW